MTKMDHHWRETTTQIKTKSHSDVALGKHLINISKLENAYNNNNMYRKQFIHSKFSEAVCVNFVDPLNLKYWNVACSDPVTFFSPKGVVLGFWFFWAPCTFRTTNLSKKEHMFYFENVTKRSNFWFNILIIIYLLDNVYNLFIFQDKYPNVKLDWY